MTSVAQIGGCNMGSGFAYSIGTIVATDAIADKIGMIRHASWGKPAIGIMTNVTFFGCDLMVRSLATCNDAVMTTGTDTLGLSVIHRARRQWRPFIRWNIMTRLTFIAAKNVVHRFTMTIDTGTNDLTVIYR